MTALSLPAATATVVLTELIPGRYLLRVAGRARGPEVREALLARGHALVAQAREGARRDLPDGLRRQVDRCRAVINEGCAAARLAQ